MPSTTSFNDIIYYELSRLTELLVKNNPNVLELLFMPEECIRLQHPLFAKLTPDLVISQLSRHLCRLRDGPSA